MTDTGYSVAEPESNGTACLVDRSWPTSREPICYDAEAAATHMQMALVQMAGIQQRKAPDAVDHELADGLRSRLFRMPTRPAMRYLMSSAQ